MTSTTTLDIQPIRTIGSAGNVWSSETARSIRALAEYPAAAIRRSFFRATRRWRKRWNEPCVGRREEGWVERGGGDWLSETLGPLPHDQCHGAFIVLQQKGAHQSTGISSRLISRGRPLFALLAPFPPPLAGPLSPRLFLSLSAPRRRHRVLRLPSSDLPPSGRRRHPSPKGQGSGKGVGSRAQIARDDVALARARGVVMKTYEIYSIWADAITPSADRGGGHSSSFPLTTYPLRGYTCARMKQVYVCEVWCVVILKIARSLFRRYRLQPRGFIKIAER